MEKTVVQKLVDIKSERVAYEAAKGKSVVWKHFVHMKVDGTVVPYVKCEKCSSVLQWKSRDGTSGLCAHVDFCNSSRASHSQPKITAIAGFSAAVESPKLPAAVKSDLTDVIVRWCAKDIRFVDVLNANASLCLSSSALL